MLSSSAGWCPLATVGATVPGPASVVGSRVPAAWLAAAGALTLGLAPADAVADADACPVGEMPGEGGAVEATVVGGLCVRPVVGLASAARVRRMPAADGATRGVAQSSVRAPVGGVAASRLGRATVGWWAAPSPDGAFKWRCVQPAVAATVTPVRVSTRAALAAVQPA